jgi:hypothetical protein
MDPVIDEPSPPNKNDPFDHPQEQIFLSVLNLLHKISLNKIILTFLK